MAEFVTVGGAADIPDGEKRLFTVGDTPINVARIEGKLYAFSDICTHQGCNLSHSDLEGHEIECECHGSVFDVTTGEVISPPAQDPLPIYPAREEDGNVQIQV